MKNSFWLVMLVGVVLGCNRSTSAPPRPAATNAPAKAELPPGHPPVGDNKLPAGHPPLDMGAQQLPPDPAAASGTPKWTAPADWKEGRVSSVRRGSFAVAGSEGQSADVAVTVFAGEVGGPLMNINRWRGQIGLEPIAADAVAGMTANLDVGGIKATVVDFTGKDPLEGKKHAPRMIVVTVPHAGNSWFFKMTGDEPLVGAQKETFLKFVQSVKF